MNQKESLQRIIVQYLEENEIPAHVLIGFAFDEASNVTGGKQNPLFSLYK